MVTIARLYDGEHNCVGPAGIWYFEEDKDDYEDIGMTNISYIWVREEPLVSRKVTFFVTREYANCIRKASSNMALDCDEILNFISLSETIEFSYRGILKEVWE